MSLFIRTPSVSTLCVPNGTHHFLKIFFEAALKLLTFLVVMNPINTYQWHLCVCKLRFRYVFQRISYLPKLFLERHAALCM